MRTENRAVVERAMTLAQRSQACLMVVSTVKELLRRAPAPDIPEPLVYIDMIDEWPPDADRSPAFSQYLVVDMGTQKAWRVQIHLLPKSSDSSASMAKSAEPGM